ncbi:MAG: hypothetical protein M1839_002421 [Geoglossum umbratile]|nr:MAG: hypothetical protein M1839_002421 [Geoglossum umbratile]
MAQKLEPVCYTGPHVRNCEKAKAKLLELNPGFNVFIYWSIAQSPSTRGMRDCVQGTFESKFGDRWYTKTWTYNYFVFQEGTIIWDGSRSNQNLCITDSNYERVGKVDRANWMGQLRGLLGTERQSKLYLSSLALPSTHDSHATAGNIKSIVRYTGLGDCQAVGVKEQLEMGVRCFDLRIGVGLHLRHGLVPLSGYLRDVLNVMSQFLDAHPSETIMFQAKRDQNGAPGAESAPHEVRELVRSYPRGQVLDAQPTLADCIGKMVLYHDGGVGAWKPCESDGVRPTGQGRNDLEERWDQVQKHLEWVTTNRKIDDGLWWTVSCAAETISRWNTESKLKVVIGLVEITRPFAFANYLIPLTLDWLVHHRGQGTLGRVELDFASDQIVHEILLWNFDYFLSLGCT